MSGLEAFLEVCVCDSTVKVWVRVSHVGSAILLASYPPALVCRPQPAFGPRFLKRSCPEVSRLMLRQLGPLKANQAFLNTSRAADSGSAVLCFSSLKTPHHVVPQTVCLHEGFFWQEYGAGV